MTKEEAILWMKVLKHAQINWVGEQAEEEDIIARCEESEQEAIDMAIEALKADWIPCSERLPNTTEQVLISVCDDHGDKPYHYTCVGWKCEACWISDNDYVFGDVIAWMPLPKPYKGGDE